MLGRPGQRPQCQRRRLRESKPSPCLFNNFPILDMRRAHLLARAALQAGLQCFSIRSLARERWLLIQRPRERDSPAWRVRFSPRQPESRTVRQTQPAHHTLIGESGQASGCKSDQAARPGNSERQASRGGSDILPLQSPNAIDIYLAIIARHLGQIPRMRPSNERSTQRFACGGLARSASRI